MSPSFDDANHAQHPSGAASLKQPAILPTSKKEMDALGWTELDILLLSGDAYVDHPSFGVALLGRWLVAHGFRVGIVAQPNWENKEQALEELRAMGRPRLFAGVTAGAIDSMLAHYTAFRKKRHDDAYTPGGKAGARPNRATIVYTGLVRQAFPGLPVVLGGIEASLRRISHYDFWSDSLRRPLLFDSKADMLIYGMGEYSLLALARIAQKMLGTQAETERERTEIAQEQVTATREQSGTAPRSLPETTKRALPRSTDESGIDRAAFVRACHAVAGIAYVVPGKEFANADFTFGKSASVEHLPAHEDMLADPRLLMQATLMLEKQVHLGASCLAQNVGDRAVVLTPPAPLLSERELDFLYALPYSRLPHPAYAEPVPAWEMIRTSITSHRGCGGGCSFCSLALHQGRRISSRSRESLLREAETIARGPNATGAFDAVDAFGVPKSSGARSSHARSSQRPTISAEHGKAAPPKWAGAISDVGGPSANMWQATCSMPAEKRCARASCMHPALCPFFAVDQQKGVRLLREISALPGVRHVRIASGVRFDLALRDATALAAYTSEFTGGQLKVAPEHSEPAVLDLMRKPGIEVFEQFLEAFSTATRKSGKDLYTVPYLMSAFPGCTEEHMRELGKWLKRKNWSPKQIQCFIPTPGTVATAMFYGGIRPDGETLFVAKSDKERLTQHYLLLEGAPAGAQKRRSGQEQRRSERSGGQGRSIEGDHSNHPGRPGHPERQDRPDRSGSSRQSQHSRRSDSPGRSARKSHSGGKR